MNGRVTGQIDFLTADREEAFLVGQANAPIDDKGNFTGEKVSVRYRGDFLEVEPARVNYMDISPKQLVSVAASLIPFLEHDDANRALMGSNMQRQGVPLLVSESPLVGTGMEGKVARDSRAVIVAEANGKIASVTAELIIVTKDGHLPEGKKKIKHDPERGHLRVRAAQVHALERRHLRQPAAHRQEGPGRPQGRRHRRRPEHRERRTRPRAATCWSRSCRGTGITSRTPS